MHIDVITNKERTPDDQQKLRELNRAVYPPDETDNGPEARMTWANTELSIIVRQEPKGDIVAHAGVLVRHCLLNGNPVLIGGVGGVKSHPDLRIKGLGRAAMTRAVEVLRDDLSAEFGLLVCPSTALGFYKALGWREFSGSLWIEQPDQECFTFSMNHVMVLPLTTEAPESGSIDLCGLPW
jgi:aminoglycoside 2'-N-acetyltransferase I